MTTYTLQPGQPGNGMDYDVRRPVPYPYHVDGATGDTSRGGMDSGRLVGFQVRSPEVEQVVDLFSDDWLDSDPEAAVGMYPVFAQDGGMWSSREPITRITVTE